MNPSEKLIAIYVRVSTVRGSDSRGQDTEMQKREIINWLTAQNLGAYRIYEDRGYSGTRDTRPALKEMLSHCRAGKISTVVCWKLDRLFRSLRHLVNSLDELQSLGIQFVALRDSIDLSTHSGRFMMQILGAVAEFEAAVIRERTRAGLANARASGKSLGRRPAKVSATQVRELRETGRTIREIAGELGVSSRKIYRVLQKLPAPPGNP